MNPTEPRHYTFHTKIIEVYQAVHQWIESAISDASGYRALPYGNLKQKILATDWKHIAFQYYTFFPTHYFKALYTLDNVVGEERLLSWLRHRQKICLLDIGCGGGAASVAFVGKVIQLKEQEKLTKDINILLIGVDPTTNAIGLYAQTLKTLKVLTSDLINLEFKFVLEGFPNAVTSIETHLKEDLKTSEVPCLSNFLVMQLNVISPFSQTYRNRQAEFDRLRAIGIDVENSSVESDSGLGTTEAQAYKQLIESIPIDVMHIVTIGTKNMEKHVQEGTNSETTLEQRIQEMSVTLRQIISNRHSIDQVDSANHVVYFENPPSCYWHDKGVTRYHTNFYIDFQTIYNTDREKDEDWIGIISLENLRLAWARARNNLLRETLCDETELRLFDLNLEFRLEGLREQLCAYANDVALTDEMISYTVPKNLTTTRPKGLSRIEEEILSVAIIQKLGDRASKLRGSSYAYRISGRYGNRDTEYLYEYWFKAYRYYMRKARDSAGNYPNGAILKVDIQSFYTKIIQDQLCNELFRELTVSERVRWLIRLLLSKDIDEHDLGQGITQGSLGSGFYSNIYLTSVDTKFGNGNEWGVELHRYVDDMILVIPNSEDIGTVEETLKEELSSLGLSLNDSKTEKIDVPTFLEQSDEDEYLESLSARFDSVVNPLWILNSGHRAIFASSYHNDDQWWHNVECYQQCLKAINIYKHTTDLSRSIYKYLFNAKKRERDLAQQKDVLELEGELEATQPPIEDSNSEILQWATNFNIANDLWVNHKNELRQELVILFQDSWQQLRDSDAENPNEIRRLQRYIRFALFRLSVLGLENILPLLMEILRESFWIIRDPINALESLARQGFHTEIRSLLRYYQALQQPCEYLKAITIRAMRFLPDIDADEWKIIVSIATVTDGSGSFIERLMATETWLCLGYKYNNFRQDHHIEAVKMALSFEPPPPSRLEKNYLLILGQFELNAVQKFSIDSNDPMIETAKNIALQGNPSEIFDLPELKILRENYYSGQGPNDSEEGSP